MAQQQECQSDLSNHLSARKRTAVLHCLDNVAMRLASQELQAYAYHYVVALRAWLLHDCACYQTMRH